MSVAPYSLARATLAGRLPMAMIRPAPRSRAPAMAMRPTGPMPMTTTVSPGWTSASSAPYRPVLSMSAARTAASQDTPAGMRAALASRSRMRAYSAMRPSSLLESFWPVMSPAQCWWAPS